MVGGIAQEIDARSEVLKIERQLQEARSKLAAIRRAKYHEKGGTGGYTDESDIDFEAETRLDSLLESSAERIHSATNSFNLMRQQQQSQSQSQQSSFTSGFPAATSTPVKPAISPKPGQLERDRKFNNASPAYSSISESSGYQHQQPTPPPPPRNFQQMVAHPPATSSTFRPQNGSGSEDLYSRPRHPEQYYSASSGSTPSTPKKCFLQKPSEFYSEVQKPSTFAPPKGGLQVMPSTFGRTFGVAQAGKEGDFSEESSHYDSGPIQSEQVIETRNPDGSISLQRVYRQEQSSSSSQRVTSSRRFFQQEEQK